MKKILIVGAGLTGAVIARACGEAGYQVTVLEGRSYVAGNCYTERDPDTDVMVHVHGPHIFHTDNESVWNYVNSYVTFMPYTLRVKATTRNSVFGLPINLLTINQFFGKTMAPKEAERFIRDLSIRHDHAPHTFEEQALEFLGEELYKSFFHDYPIKQWGLHPSQLPASVLKRLPVRFNYDDNYFAHRFQGMPSEGYTALVEKIIDHENVEVRLSTKFERSDRANFDHVFYSGPLDEWFDCDIGNLGYRTLSFEREVHDGDYQGCAVMSYPESTVPFTRISEHKHFAPWEAHDRTVIFKEYSAQARPGDIPYYPIRLANEQSLLKRYVERARLESNVSFVGRLATYRYLDMDVTIGEAMAAAKGFLEAEARLETIPTFFVDPS